MAHGFLSYQDTRGDNFWKNAKDLKDGLDWLRKQFRKDLRVVNANIEEVRDIVEEKKLPQGQTPLLKGGNDPALPQGSPLQKMLSGSALSRAALPGAIAANPEVMGGPLATAGFAGKRIKPEGFVGDAIVDIGATSLGVERDIDGSDMFVKRLNTVDGGESGEVVQAIDRLTFVTMSLVAATKEQTQQQMLIAARQEQSAEKMARDAKALAEENALEMGSDLSGNLSYERLANIAGGVGGGGRGLGGFGAKAAATNLGKAAMKRGGARAATRLGAGLGMKVAGKSGAKIGAKIGAKTLGGVVGKKLPFGLGLAVAGGFAADRFGKGDVVGGVGEILSGLAAIVPGVGTAASLGIDGLLAARDFGLTPFADGGIISKPTAGLVGEAGKEGIFPLEGAKGKKTFRMFGEGLLEAQKRNKNENAKRLAEGLREYYDKQNGWERFLEMMGNLFPKFEFKWPWEQDPPDPNNNRNRRGGGGTSGNINAADIDADSPEAKALIATIREVEGTAHAKGYDTWFGGRKDMKMTDMTLQEVYDEQTRRLNSGQATYNGLTSAAVGVGQFMDPLNQAKAMYAARGEAFDPTKIKFDEKLQNDLLLDLAARKRGIDPSKKLTLADFEVLQKEWAGLGTYYGQTKRTTADSLRIYEGNLKEAQENQPTPKTPPSSPTPTGGDRRQSDASQRISQNFGRKAGQSISFVHNGQDYHAVKTTNGWDIYKGKGGIFGGTRVATDNGKNKEVVDSFLEQAAAGGGYRVPDGSETSVLEDLERFSTANAGNGADVNKSSTEVAMASIPKSGGTVINNFYGTGGSNGGGNQPANVPIGPSKSDMGAGLNNIYEMSIG